jgi:dihydrofolate reductase
MGAVVSLDGFIADDEDGVGPLFDWFGNGDVAWAFEGAEQECRSTQASADFMRSQYRDLAAVVIGRRLFDPGGLAEPLRLENPTTIVAGDRVTHLVYDVSR